MNWLEYAMAVFLAYSTAARGRRSRTHHSLCPGTGRLAIELSGIPRYNLPLDRTAAEILEQARKLPPSEINWLVGELLQEGDGSSEAEIEASWKSEVERRVADAAVGNGSTCSWEEVQAPLRARLSK
jgi:putative addiction module component (TIGR02574 family)